MLTSEDVGVPVSTVDVFELARLAELEGEGETETEGEGESEELALEVTVLLPPQVKKHRKIIAPHSQNEPPIVE